MIKGTKICGVSDIKTLEYIINHPFPCQFIGFITNFKKSKRYVEFDILKKLTCLNNNKISFVAVLVKPTDKELEKIKDLKFDYYQLYDVDPDRTKLIKKKYNKKIISALTIQTIDDVKKYKMYEKISDIILFDGIGYEKSLGFDHNLLKIVPKSITKMIAGNIKIENIPKLENIEYFVDVSGSLEDKNGKKDLQKIDYFLENTK